jgi:hypothetical protein
MLITTSWRGVPIYAYEGQYTDSGGKSQYYVPPNCVLVAATGLQNKMAYAAVAQLDDSDSGFQTMSVYEGRRILQVFPNIGSDSRSLHLSARPVRCPTNLNSWRILQTGPDSPTLTKKTSK